MWHALTSFFSATVSPYGVECSVTLPRHPLPGPGFEQRIVPAPDGRGLALAWQDGDSILLQWFTKSCAPSGATFEVNRSQEFWGQPASSGLNDAVALRGGAAAVVWTLGGDVWARLVHADGSCSPAARASGAGNFDRAEAKVTASPVDGSFVVVWSSWGQDGDGWGVFARPFDDRGRPAGEERQVNQAWEHFQWQPQLTWCGDSLWAMWSSGTGGRCHGITGDCVRGPIVRRLATAGAWDPGDEVNLHGDGPIMAALGCTGEATNGSQAVAALWLKHHGQEVRWEYVQPSRSGLHGASSRRPRRDDRSSAASEGQAPPASRRPGPRQLGLRPAAGARHLALGGADAGAEALARSLTRADAAVVSDGQLGVIDASNVRMLAHRGLLMIVSGARDGSISAQLTSYSASARPMALPRRHLAFGAQFRSAAWDPAEDLAFVACWAAGGGFEDSDPSVFTCTRHGVSWFVGHTAMPSLASALGLGAMFSVLYVCCSLRRCSHAPLGSWGPVASARRIAPVLQHPSAREGRLRWLREVRQRLSGVPGAQLGRGRAGDGASGEESSDPGQSLERLHNQDAPDALFPEVDFDAADEDFGADPASEDRGSDGALVRGVEAKSQTVAPAAPREEGVCPICQEEMAMFIALRPCGHTACKDCTLRLVEGNHRCHICRSGIKGVQPVYL